jgi:hypothetical protein
VPKSHLPHACYTPSSNGLHSCPSFEGLGSQVFPGTGYSECEVPWNSSVPTGRCLLNSKLKSGNGRFHPVCMGVPARRSMNTAIFLKNCSFACHCISVMHADISAEAPHYAVFSRHFIPLRTKYFRQHPFLNTLSLCSFLNARDQVSHPSPHHSSGG